MPEPREADAARKALDPVLRRRTANHPLRLGIADNQGGGLAVQQPSSDVIDRFHHVAIGEFTLPETSYLT